MTIFISLTGSFLLSIIGFFLAKLVVETCWGFNKDYEGVLPFHFVIGHILFHLHCLNQIKI